MKVGSIEDQPPVNREFCPIVEAIRQMGGEWNMIVVRYLLDKPMGFNEILRSARGMNSKTLSRVLKNLQEREIVNRKVLSTQPFSVEYSLTEKGTAIKPIMEQLKKWGADWVLSSSSQLGDEPSSYQ